MSLHQFHNSQSILHVSLIRERNQLMLSEIDITVINNGERYVSISKSDLVIFELFTELLKLKPDLDVSCCSEGVKEKFTDFLELREQFLYKPRQVATFSKV